MNKFTEQIILLADLMADAGVDPEVALVGHHGHDGRFPPHGATRDEGKTKKTELL